jgi:glyoxylase-like metal-dependent hydrolase (beta-lactamase superfamily II)
MSALTIAIGDAIVTRVEDSQGLGFMPGEMLANYQPGQWEAERDWLVPAFYDPQADRLRTSIHSWLVRTPHHTVLIDACIGNHKRRPSIERFNMRNEPWIERLAAAGASPDDIDFVMCTHLHADHVGWNTHLVDGRWVPTFPNAKYLFTQAEFDRWDDRRADYVARPLNQYVFADSILPVVESGQMVLVDDGHTVDNLLTVEAAYGHSAGHVKIRLKSRGEQGMFAGDTIHHPLQLPFPHLRSVFDEDPDKALQVRLAMLEDCVATGALLMPTHFAAPHCCHVERQKPPAGVGAGPVSYRGRWHGYAG